MSDVDFPNLASSYTMLANGERWSSAINNWRRLILAGHERWCLTITGRDVVDLPSLLAPTELILKVATNGDEKTEGKDGACDSEGAAIARRIILTKNLGTVDPSDVSAHDDERHRKRPLLRVRAGKRHPGDIQRVREGGEGLSPHDAKVLRAATVGLGEDAVEDVT